jgi:hypothetical protein
MRPIALEPGQSVTVRRVPFARLCSWCLARPVERRGAKYCSHSCRQRAFEWRKRIGELIADAEAANRQVITALATLRDALSKRQLTHHPVQKETENAQSATQRT